MGEVEFSKDDEYNVKIVDGGDIKEPGGAIRKPTQEEIDSYRIHRLVVMVIFGIVVVVLLLVVVIMIATIDRCEAVAAKEKVPSLSWWEKGVVYNIYPRSFKDSDDDGVGDFKGISQKLDYLKDLGVNILYLSSVFKIDKNYDYGYAVVDFKDTNPEYGTITDFKNLLDKAHEKDLKVIIEFIPNDTSLKHKWFNESLNSNSAKRDWYIWQDTDSGTSGDTCWKKHPKNDKYYLYYCKYSNDTGKADLNWDNADVQKELESALGFWLDKGVDGFRLVSVARMFDNMKPQPSNDVTKIHATLNKWHNYTRKRNEDSMLMGASHGASTAYYGTMARPELDIVVNFVLVPENNATMGNFYSAGNFEKLIKEYIGSVPEGKWPSWALTSWVHKRVGTNVSPKLAKALNIVLLTLPGTPIVFYGDEIGMKDVQSVSQPRDGNKAPMQWNNEKNGGFSESSLSWFGVVGNSAVVNAKDDQYGNKKLFTEAVKFRNDNLKSLISGNLANFTTAVKEGSVLVYTFEDSDPQFVVVINFGSSTKTVNLSSFGKKGDIKLSTSDKNDDDVEMKAVKVAGEEALVIKLDD